MTSGLSSSTSLEYIITHVFLPVQLPKKSDYTPENDLQLLRVICTAAHAYTAYVSDSYGSQWQCITKMLDNLQVSMKSGHLDRSIVISQLDEMETGNILALFVRPRNTALLVRKYDDCALIESFEVSPSEVAVMEAGGPLICQYPDSAVEIPNEVFVGVELQSKLVDFVSSPHIGSAPDGPQITTAMFFGELLRVGSTADVSRITKRIRDDIFVPAYASLGVYDDPYSPSWRRSSLWLLIRVVIQTFFHRASLGRPLYKQVLLFFLCTLAVDESNLTLSDDLLHLMACKILRRLNKFGLSIPEWLSEIAFKACASLRDILDTRRMNRNIRPSAFRNPSQDELIRDSECLLQNTDKYIRQVLANLDQNHSNPPFRFDHRSRGTIEDFLSSNGTFFTEACATDRDVTLWDVGKLVEQGIFDDWVANLTNVDKACSQIEILMDAYLEARLADGSMEGEERSIELLTGIELFVAVDKLAAREIPTLADYSPEIPLQMLEPLLVRNRTSLHRLSCVYQYLSARHSRSLLGWSILSDNFTEDSFPVRYYDQSRELQELKVRIEANVGPLPVSPLLTKVIVFELQCPTIIRVWRSSVARILHHLHLSRYTVEDKFSGFQAEEREHLLARDSELHPYFVSNNVSTLHVQLHFTYFCPEGKGSIPTTRYAVEYLPPYDDDFALARWQPSQYEVPNFDPKVGFFDSFPAFGDRHSYLHLARYASTSHTSNHVLACQVFCPPDFTLDEFLAFAYLRAGGSLQWPNILHGLRSRQLSLRRIEVHCLIFNAVLQVGPLDLNTGTFIWHEELQDLSFCNAFLDELEILLFDAVGGSVDAVLTCTISMLLTRIVEMSPSEGVSYRSISLLRRIRSYTLSWIEELLYNLAVAPANKERGLLLLDMVATCRSTFDVGPESLPKILGSAEDVDAVLSCALLTKVLCPKDTMGFHVYRLSTLLFRRNHCISLALENFLKDAILTDPSQYGIDLAVCKVLGHKQLGTKRWEPLQCPDERWVKCKPDTIDQCSRTVHVNLLTGEIRVGGQRLPGLPLLMLQFPEWQYIFRDRGFLLIPSELPTMDFTTHIITPGYRMHFSLRDDVLVVQAQHNHTGNILQHIAREILRDDIPPALINGHVHWLDLSTKTIEMHPVGHTLESASEHWKIDFTSGRCRVYKGCSTLVDMQSETWRMVLQCFGGLQSYKDPSQGHWRLSNNLLVVTSPVDSLQSERGLHLSVTLPAYSLSFFVNAEGELESCDFKDMVYDENQCIGTLFGLESLLVLRPKTYIGDRTVPEGLVFRRVLVPDGNPQKLEDDRIRIDCVHTSVCYAYDVDTEVGRLNGDGSMRSTECLAYLHEVTGVNHWPDPLTCKSGSEAALCILRSGGCRSVFRIKEFSFQGPTERQSPRYMAIRQGIERNYYWRRDPDLTELPWITIPPDYAAMSLERAVQRAAHLEPTSGTPTRRSRPSTTKDNNYDDPSRSHVIFETPLHRLFSRRRTPELPARTPSTLLQKTGENVSINTHELTLESLFSSLPVNGCDPAFQREYIALLENSAQSAREDSQRNSCTLSSGRVGALQEYYIQCRSAYFNALNVLRRCLDPTVNLLEKALQQFGLWPPITGDSLLQCLASASPIANKIPSSWKKCLTSFALLLLDLQRSRRLLLFALRGLEEEFSKELENEPCDGWDPEEYPDWLLIQIQGNFLIRRVQAKTAMEMMLPKSGENTVMQVNMGEGKSSVIIPMVAAALANGTQLVRVVVPKALTMQMFEILLSRLGGLANRPIYILPFSRNSHGDSHSLTSANLLQEMILQCMEQHGILLVEPAHAVSLKLMSIDKQIRNGTRNLVDHQLVKPAYDLKFIMSYLPLISLIKDSFLGYLFQSLSQSHARQVGDNKDIASATLGGPPSMWLELQKWIDSHARDILDESDEILHTRTQFVYANGHRQHVDGYPERWIIIQRVLGLLKQRAHTLSKNHQNSIEYELGPPGSFPHIHLTLSSDVGGRLISLLVEDVMDDRLPELNFQNMTPVLHDAIRAFISDENVLQLPDTVKIVEDFAKNSQFTNLWNALLLLRGLLASGILLFTLAEQRWRVDYGLTPRNHRHEDSRFTSDNQPTTLLAVPYRAKDMPAPYTQFGHPDIAIILTCLSYYYAGLTKDQLRASFEILLDEGDPSIEYAHWVEECDPKSLPVSLQTLGDIMLKSSEQWDKVTFPLFTRNQATINFYLSRVVFPKEAQGFPWKISASGWDLAEKREKLITGFSGTNDGRWLLPMSIAQRDLEHQKGTNAKIISYLLLPENDFYIVTNEKGERWNTMQLLQVVAKQQPQIRVLVDVGAQILDFSNIQLAREWLNIDRDASGAIYFSEYDELMVLTRAGTKYPLLSSPFSQQLHRCVVYLDHAHTRGTDLKLPNGSRAAVTLGPRLTKDSLVQGCMRMRKLGQPNGHSVMFFAPLEVDYSIRAVARKKDRSIGITVVDVLCWTIQETWSEIQRRAPYWAQQGMCYRSRHEAWSRFCKGDITPDKLVDAWLEPERKTLNDLYAPLELTSTPSSVSQLDPDIRQRCNTLGVLSLPTAKLDEGQEREVNQEWQREREIEIPPWAKPLEHALHPSVVNFIKTGILPLLDSDSGSAFVPVFTTLEKSTVSTRDANVWSPSVLATADFCRTIDPDSTAGTMDQYLRPVQWVLTRRNIHDPVLVLLSPFEVCRLLPDIRESEHVHLHLYAPRTAKTMKPSDDLRLYTIPPLPSEWNPPWALIDQLNIFAGQLYLRDYQTYLRLCRFLDTSTMEPPESGEIRWNRLKIPGSLEEDEVRFSNSPLPFVNALLCIRNRGQSFGHTHMGRILQGEVLNENDFKMSPACDASCR